MSSKKYAEVRRDYCVACGACKNICPRNAIEISKGCFANVNKDICAGCGKCERICPAGTIIMKERGAL